MDFEAAARREVEETLRTDLDAIERGVARGRLGLFGILTAFMLVLSVALLGGFLPGAPLLGTNRVRGMMPLLMFGSGLLYAIGVWRRVSRNGAEPAFTALVAFADGRVLLVIVTTLRRVMPSSGEAEPLAARFDIYGLAPILLVVAFLGCVRI